MCGAYTDTLFSLFVNVSILTIDLFRHFTIRGADDTDFAGGVYHGRILLPPEYPFKPPNIVFLTPSGRFEVNTKICLSFSAYHPELWQPAWGIRLILEALISFLPTPADGAIGALDWSPAERKRLAQKSQSYVCNCCGKIVDLLPKLKKSSSSASSGEGQNRFQKEIANLQLLQQQQHAKTMEEERPKEGSESKKTLEAAQEGDERKIEAEGAACTDKGDVPAVESSSTPGLVPESPVLSTTPTVDAEDASHPNSDQGESLGGRRKTSLSPLAADTATPSLGVTASENETSSPLEPLTMQQGEGTLAQERPLEATNTQESVPEDGSFLLDPLLQAMIAIVAVLCILLFRKVQSLMEDLQALQ